jgi:hypothetical protein
MLRSFCQFLQQPYPGNADWRSILSGAVWGGLIVFFVLFAFRPFGFHTIGSNLWLYCLLFGGITAGVIILYDGVFFLLLDLRKDRPSWTLGKWLLSTLGLMFFIGLANYVAIIELTGQPYRWWLFLSVWQSTMLVGTIPLFVFGAVTTIRNLKANQAIAATLSPQPVAPHPPQRRRLPLQAGGEHFDLVVDELLMAEAQQNYVHLYLRQGDTLRREMLRTTLSAVEAALQDTPVWRSHRSFLVNVEAIVEIDGNAQGLTLRLDSPEPLQVPVSRKYLPAFRALETPK